MQTATEVFEAVRARCEERGARLLPAGVIAVEVNGMAAVVPPPADLETMATFPAQRAGAAVITLAEFAQAANRVMTDPRLTASAKAADVVELGKRERPKLAAILTEAGEALAAAEQALAKETTPVPIDPAGAADAVIDGELRGLLRAMALHQQMAAVRDEFAYCRAALRQPLGFDDALIKQAREWWAVLNPNAPAATEAAKAVASWRSARDCIGQCVAAFDRLAGSVQRAAA